jgi:hypothetical protein
MSSKQKMCGIRATGEIKSPHHIRSNVIIMEVPTSNMARTHESRTVLAVAVLLALALAVVTVVGEAVGLVLVVPIHGLSQSHFRFRRDYVYDK